MATAESLGGRRTPTSPKPKSDKTVTFVGEDGQEIEVVTSISKGALAVLKKQGYKKKSERSSGNDDDDDSSAPAKKAAPKSS